MAEEKFADFDKSPAHAVVADKRCRYHLAPVLGKKYSRLAVVGLVRQQQIGQLLQTLLPLGIIRGCINGRKHIIRNTIRCRRVKNDFVLCMHIS